MDKAKEVVVYLGSGKGGYTANWKVIAGKVKSTPTGATKETLYIERKSYVLTPITETAIVEFWEFDDIQTFRSGQVTLVK